MDARRATRQTARIGEQAKHEWPAVRDAILGQGMLPLIMETDSANPSRGIITGSLAKVDEADAYVVLISNYRYGQVIDDRDLNPEGLSVTELEFRHAEKRGLPLCIYLMDENVPVPPPRCERKLPGPPNWNCFESVRAITVGLSPHSQMWTS